MTTKFKLQNGLTVLLVESHKAPVVSIQAWVKTGSADEKKGQEGISHFIEHLVFKGTKDFKVGEIAKTIEANGGELNAYTSFDQTVFYVTISKQFYDIGLHAVSEMVGFPKFDENEINNEREVVIEEIKRSLDSAHSQASWQMFKECFKKHPYGTPIIGYDKIIRKVSRKTLVQYFNERYTPQNMILVISGDFEVKEMKNAATKYFGRLKKTPVKKVTRKKEPPQKSARVAVKKSTFEENYAYIAWKVPNISHKDLVSLDLLAMILGEGESSRLYKTLRLEKPLVKYVGASTFSYKDPGLLFVVATFNLENLEEFFSKLKEILMSALTIEPTAQEMEKAIIQLESDEYYGLESVEGLARKAGFLEYFMGDHKFYPKYMKQIYATTPSMVLKMARKYLDPKSLNLSVLLSKDANVKSDFFKKWIKEYQELYKKSIKQKPQPGKKPKLKKVTLNIAGSKAAKAEIFERQLENGTRVFFRRTLDTPVISVRSAFLGGLRAEPAGREGLTELLSRVWTSGTKRRDENEIINITETIAGRLGAYGGRNTAGVAMTVLTPFEDDGIELFSDILSNPIFPEGVTAREKQILIDSIKTQNDEPAHIAVQLFLEKMFRDHPYGKDLHGKIETVEKITRNDLSQHFTKMAMQKNLMIVVSGYADPDKWMKGFSEAIKTLNVGDPYHEKFPLSPLKTSDREFKELQKEQTHIVMGYRGIDLKDERRYTLNVMQSILAGQGGRLFLELRDKASLAYTVSPIRFDGLESGYFGAYIGCSPDKGKKSVEMMKREFDKICEIMPDEAELERAKRYLIGRHDIELQRNSTFASSILFNEIYGIPRDEIFEFPEKIRAVKASDVRDLAQTILQKPEILVAVGSQCPW